MHSIRPSLLLLIAAAPGLSGQDQPFLRAGTAEVRAELVRTPAWSFETRTGSFVNRSAGYDAGTSLGLRLGFAPIAALAVFGAAQWDGGGFGDTSGFTVVEGGVEGRIGGVGRLVPRVNAAGGRFSESGGVWFTYLSGGVGVDWYLSRAVSLGADLRRLAELSTGSNLPGSTTTADADLTRIHFGVAVRF